MLAENSKSNKNVFFQKHKKFLIILIAIIVILAVAIPCLAHFLSPSVNSASDGKNGDEMKTAKFRKTGSTEPDSTGEPADLPDGDDEQEIEWLWQSKSKWNKYTDAERDELETNYQEFLKDKSGKSKCKLQKTWDIDFSDMTQRGHHTKRNIRRDVIKPC